MILKRKMKKLIFLPILFLFVTAGFVYSQTTSAKKNLPVVSPLSDKPKEPGLLEKYAFENLQKRLFIGSQIEIGRVLEKKEKYTSYVFFYQSDGKKISGQLNLPKGEGKFPVVLMLRGYVDDKIYTTGMGTKKPAAFFAENGFITLAPDFLGFGYSDTTYPDILEDRFYRPVAVLDLFASVKTLNQAKADKIFLWGHSNGGQIAISVLEISQKMIPTVLWAPVTKGFPESVTTYMDQLDDLGLKVKQRLDFFVKDYNPQKFSTTTYLADIKAPIQVHQGTGDEYIEVGWTEDFVQRLKNLGKPVTYFTYQGDNHNLSINWDQVTARDLEFFKKNLKE